MDASENDIRFIARREGGVLVAYVDGPPWEDGPEKGLPRMSKGFGHQDRAVKAGDTITLKEAFQLLRQDVIPRSKRITALLKVPLEQHQFGALLSLHFQSGNRYMPKLVELINQGNSQGAIDLFPSCNRNLSGQIISGLTKRRLLEQHLFLTGDYGELSPIPLWRGDPRKTKPEMYEVTDADLSR